MKIYTSVEYLNDQGLERIIELKKILDKNLNKLN